MVFNFLLLSFQSILLVYSIGLLLTQKCP